MAWISVHEQLKDHRKVRELARLLGCNRHEALGILVTLWLWGINNADRDGDLGTATATDIADGVMYRSQSPEQFIDCLLQSGWVDGNEGVGFVLHDWDTWQEAWFKALDRREQSKTLMRELRGKKRDVSKQLAQPLTECEHNVSTSPSPNRHLTVTLPSDKKSNDVSVDTSMRQAPEGAPKRQSIIDGYTDNENVRSEIREFIWMRQRIRKPMTDHALELLLKRLTKLATSDAMKIAVLQQSTVNGWQSIYELKPEAGARQETGARAAVAGMRRMGDED